MSKVIKSAGVHVTIDAYVRDASVFTDNTLRSLFKKLASALDMTIIHGPEFVEVPINPETLKRSQETGIFEDEGGITGICVVSKSHISCHCWPLQKFFSLDIFSCGEFKPSIALNIVREQLGVIQEDVLIHNRRKPLEGSEIRII